MKLITYDLNQPGQKYEDLIEEIKDISGEWAHFLESTWLITSALTPNQIVDRLKSHLDASDSLLVIDVAGDTKQGWLTEEQWKWINARW